MKLKKILSLAAASVVAASVVATSASADWDKDVGGELAPGIDIGTANYMINLFCNDELSDDIILMDRGIDLSKLGYVSFTFQVNEDDREFFDGQFGGGVGASIHAWDKIPGKPGKIREPKEDSFDTPEEYAAAKDKYDKQIARNEIRQQRWEEYEAGGVETKIAPSGSEETLWDYYNWMCSYQYWGVLDPGAKDPMSYDIDGEYIEGMPEYINYLDPNQPAFLETLGNYTYRIKTPIANPVVDGYCEPEDIEDFRVYFQCWNASAFKATVIRTVLYDLDGKAMMAFDKLGNVVETNADDDKEPVMPEPPVEGEEPAESTPASEPADSSDATSDSAATPAASEPTSTPAASSTATQSNGMPVGAIVGIIAGVVVVVVVVVVIVVKKKKG